jgi:hypothetical protein
LDFVIGTAAMRDHLVSSGGTLPRRLSLVVDGAGPFALDPRAPFLPSSRRRLSSVGRVGTLTTGSQQAIG